MNATEAKACRCDAKRLQSLAGNATVRAAVAALAAKRPVVRATTNGNAIHGCAVAIGGTKEKDCKIEALSMLPAHVILGTKVVALAAKQHQAPMTRGQLPPGRMLAGKTGKNEHLQHATESIMANHSNKTKNTISVIHHLRDTCPGAVVDHCPGTMLAMVQINR